MTQWQVLTVMYILMLAAIQIQECALYVYNVMYDMHDIAPCTARYICNLASWTIHVLIS